MSTNMRGLNTFITDIRHCSNKEQEEKRVEKELQKIRGKFTSQKGLAGYQKKKYVWKLLYIYILGYEVDFGQQECAFLINSSKFSEKYTGYVATSILVSEKTHDLFTQVASSIRNDLQSVNEINQSLALTMVGTQAPQELVNALHQDVQKLALTESRSTFHVRKKACACLLRMYRKYQDKFQPSQWAQGISQMFESRHPSLGFMTAATSLLVGTCQLNNPSIFEDCTPKLIKLLHKIAIQKDSPGDYNYYATPAPWLQVKILKALSFFSPPPPSTDSHRQLTECLTKIIKKTEVTKSINKNNVDHGILFEAANLVITYNGAVGMELKNDILKLLGIFISVKEPNLRYLGLETMCKFVKLAGDSLEDHLNTIFKSLRDNDISIRKRALDLLYLISSPNTSQRIVEELLSYAENGADLQIKDDLVLKIAILSEKFADNLYWYIDVVVRMINSSGDFVTEDIWFRIIQIIVGFQKEGNQELQKYAATKLFSQLSMPHVHETLICIGAFIISEYSQMLVEQNKEPQKLFDILNKHYTFSTERSRQMLLNAFVKLACKYPELRDQAIMICQIAGEHFDPDIQQRGIEYFSLLMEDDKLLNQIVVKMPPYSELVQQNNPLTKRIYVMVLNPKEQKDPTLLNQARIQASQEIAMAEQRLQSKPEQLQKHLSWLKACPYLNQFQGQIALEGVNIMVPPSPEDNNLKSPTISNVNEIKVLLTSQIGKIVDKPGDLVVQYKSEISGHLGKVSFQFEGTSPIQNLSILVSQTNGMLFNILPVKQGDFPQVMMQVLSCDGNMTLPIASIFYEQNGQQKKHEFHLPIYTNKFVQPVDMPYDKFTKFFDDFTNNLSNQNYFKLDSFIRNTAPSNIPMSEVLKKAGGLLSVGLNLKAQPFPSLENLQMIWACGQLMIKPPEQNNILNLPIMVIISSLDQTNEFLRVGIRCGGNGEIAKNYMKLIMLYLG
ncbi:unnamed protein product [Paramecium octaurelia]|uniref:AP-2 complex subunit alpha n=1 Tax=Paramecium octaurelia TaxID=43137 RepID=A0A8S1UWT0_PAROT|nr:unnamed protein product [Paramecium octaurelia]